LSEREMTPLLLVSIIAVVGASVGLIHAIRHERKKGRDTIT
jgi:phosphotransferase system  glucose/maltose/N-acetylglucosamine-specific IIC component